MGGALYGVLETCLRRQGYRVAYASVTTDNPGSVAFHQAMGYTQRALFPNCGYKLGQWHGVIWLEKQLMQPGDPTGFPEPWSPDLLREPL